MSIPETFTPSSLILYVADVDASTRFYRRLLRRDPVARFEDFTVFPFAEGASIGLQAADGIDPAPQSAFGGFEISMSDASRAQVDELYRTWASEGVPMVLEPTELEFGYTFVALDPDGHRLRVCATDTSDIASLPVAEEASSES